MKKSNGPQQHANKMATNGARRQDEIFPHTMTLGPTTHTVSQAYDIVLTLYLFITLLVEEIILETTNLEGF